MTNNAKVIADEVYSEANGMKRIEVVERPPKIAWGEKFQEWDDKKKIDWLTKFGESMNHAADLIQNERNELCRLVEAKEKQLEQMKMSVEANQRMVQSEVTKMNEYKQGANKTIAGLHARIKELEGGDDD